LKCQPFTEEFCESEKLSQEIEGKRKDFEDVHEGNAGVQDYKDPDTAADSFEPFEYEEDVEAEQVEMYSEHDVFGASSDEEDYQKRDPSQLEKRDPAEVSKTVEERKRYPESQNFEEHEYDIMEDASQLHQEEYEEQAEFQEEDSTTSSEPETHHRRQDSLKIPVSPFTPDEDYLHEFESEGITLSFQVIDKRDPSVQKRDPSQQYAEVTKQSDIDEAEVQKNQAEYEQEESDQEELLEIQSNADQEDDSTADEEEPVNTVQAQENQECNELGAQHQTEHQINSTRSEEEHLTAASLDGQWTTDFESSFRIEGTDVIWHDGETSQIDVEDDMHTLWLTLGGEKYKGQLSGTTLIVWEDGEEWNKLVPI